jgi:hypothetical protein
MKFLLAPTETESILRFFDDPPDNVILVSRHGLGDNIFFSPCLSKLSRKIKNLYFCSSVNAYTSLFHNSPFVTPLYWGGANGSDLGLSNASGFCKHFEGVEFQLPHDSVYVYHIGLTEPPLPYDHPKAFVKGRRNMIEIFGDGPSPLEVPRYHISPDHRSKEFVAAAISDWLPDRELICIARYGHTDPKKNFGHTFNDSLDTLKLIDHAYPGRFKYISLDYSPGRHTLDGRMKNVRSVYGFLPCDASSLYFILSLAKLLITVPTGPMLMGACIEGLDLITLWKESYLKPFHYLDPQFGRPVTALVESEKQMNFPFTNEWGSDERSALASRWRIFNGEITPESVAQSVYSIIQ